MSLEKKEGEQSMTTKTEKKKEPSASGGESPLNYARVLFVPLDRARPNPWQPRRAMANAGLTDLAEDIARHGLLQPAVGRMVGDTIELAFGHRRLMAIKALAGDGRWTSGMPVSVREITDAQMALYALSENSKREDLSPLDEYRAYSKALAEIDSLTITDLADSIGVARSTLSNDLRILKLPEVVLERFESGELGTHAAREFLCLMNDDHAHEREMAKVIMWIANTHGVDGAPDWRVKHVEKRIRDVMGTYDADWRPVAKRTSDTGYIVADAYGREPSFDFEAFIKAHPDQVHMIPTLHDSKTRAWTCNVKDWRRLQTAGTRAANKEAAETGKPAPAKGRRKQELQERLTNDPVLAQLRKAVSKETHWEGEKQVSRVAPTGPPTEAELEKLGTRAEFFDQLSSGKNFSRFHQRLGKDSVLAYFPDLNECLNKCTWGASFGQDSQGAPVELYCMNKEKYEEKLARGKAAYRQRVDKAIAAADADETELAVQVAGRAWDADAAGLVAAALLQSNDGAIGQRMAPGVPDRAYGTEYADFRYYPRVLSDAVQALGLELKASMPWKRNHLDVAAALKGLVPLQGTGGLPGVAARLMVWSISEHAKDPSVVKKFLKYFNGGGDDADKGTERPAKATKARKNTSRGQSRRRRTDIVSATR